MSRLGHRDPTWSAARVRAHRRAVAQMTDLAVRGRCGCATGQTASGGPRCFIHRMSRVGSTDGRGSEWKWHRHEVATLALPAAPRYVSALLWAERPSRSSGMSIRIDRCLSPLCGAGRPDENGSDTSTRLLAASVGRRRCWRPCSTGVCCAREQRRWRGLRALVHATSRTG